MDNPLIYIDPNGYDEEENSQTNDQSNDQSNDQTVTKDDPPPSKSGYEPPKGGPEWGKTKDGKEGWVDKNGNVWVPAPTGSRQAHGGGHWDVQYPKGGYDNVFPNGRVRAGSGSRGKFSPPGKRSELSSSQRGFFGSPSSDALTNGLIVVGAAAAATAAVLLAPETGGVSLFILAL